MAEQGGAIAFLIFYTVLFGLMIYFEGAIGVSILESSIDFQEASATSITWWEGFFSMWSEYTLINIILMSPLVVVGVYLIVTIIADLLP